MNISNRDSSSRGSKTSRKLFSDSPSPFPTNNSTELEIIDYDTLSVISSQETTSRPSKKSQKTPSKAKGVTKKELNSSKTTFNEDHHAVPFDYSTLNSQSSLSSSNKPKRTRKINPNKDNKVLEIPPEDVATETNEAGQVTKEKNISKPRSKQKGDKKPTQVIEHDVENLTSSLINISLNATETNNSQTTSSKSSAKSNKKSRETKPRTPRKTTTKSESKDKANDKSSEKAKSDKAKESLDLQREESSTAKTLDLSENSAEQRGDTELITKKEESRKTRGKNSTSTHAQRPTMKANKELAQEHSLSENRTPRKQSRQKNELGDKKTPKSQDRLKSASKRSERTPKHSTTDATPTSHSRRSRRRCIYEEYLTPNALKAALEKKLIHQGILRINKRNRSDAYVTSDAFEQDIYICGARLRNRALNGDSVAVVLLSGEKLDHAKEQRVLDAEKRGRVLYDVENEAKLLFGEVVYIFERGDGNKYSGVLMLDRPNGQGDPSNNRRKGNAEVAWFIPADKRVPYIIIPSEDIPKDFFKDPEAYRNQIVVASIKHWASSSMFPFGKIVRKVGTIGNVLTETEALLADNNVRTDDFSSQVKKCLPQTPWTIPETEIQRRRDLRQERIFTIDPATAKDLDDAVSCRRLPDGNLEIGVHIADVSFFVKPDTALDREAKLRATTVYLVQKAIPMLPNVLCQDLCSLNPGVDRLAFSVMWKMTPDAKVLDVWFGRTVISSCCRLAYEQAQEVILGNPLDPNVTLYNQPKNEVESDIKTFYNLSQIMRKRRFENGALSINSIRLNFHLDSDGIPITCQVYDLKESNRLIEEFMLLANISVAQKITAAYPEQAFLRRHAPPLEKRMSEFVKIAKDLGYDINSDTAGALQESLNSIDSPSIKHVLQALCIKPMQRAKYFCAGSLDPSKYQHYALSVPLYTHFTSPIRRYADVIVHRELQSILLGNEEFQLPADKIQKIADNCNTKKDAAKNAQEMSSHIYLAVYLYNLTQSHGPIVCNAVVIDVVEKGFDVLVPEFGIEQRIYIDKLPVESSNWDSDNKTFKIQWKKDTQVHIPKDEPSEDLTELLQDISFDDACLDDMDGDISGDEEDYAHLSGIDFDDPLEESYEDEEIHFEDDIEKMAKTTPSVKPEEDIPKLQPSQNKFFDSNQDIELSGDIQTIRILGNVKVLITSNISKSPAIINVIATNPLVPI
ncbi:hypothetical protein K7432_000332 [Basidiobolus ranarum]|uniref:DIS3-like exonuclease 2 n=1 Tax=Basidiobolus ranarum TaxID=34480 RepID=A0ABR2WBC1_9FUNG